MSVRRQSRAVGGVSPRWTLQTELAAAPLISQSLPKLRHVPQSLYAPAALKSPPAPATTPAHKRLEEKVAARTAPFRSPCTACNDVTRGLPIQSNWNQLQLNGGVMCGARAFRTRDW